MKQILKPVTYILAAIYFLVDAVFMAVAMPISRWIARHVEFKRLRAGAGATEVTVKTVMNQPGIEPLTIDYDMEKLAAGWKVYDIKIDGVSLITTYRETFAGKVREGGVENLIRSLADKNRQGEGRVRLHQTANSYFPAIVRSLLQGGT